MNIVIGPLEALYIVGAITLLIIVLVAYPTLLRKNRRPKKLK
ncbi:MAG: hypothetical protein ACK4FL_00075 [Microgenomates group bacterium]